MVYKNKVIILGCCICCLDVGCSPGEKAVVSGALEEDGFPSIGTYLTDGDPYYR